MLRADYLISGRHTLMLRGDLRAVDQEPTRVSATALPETGADNSTSGGGVLVSLPFHLGGPGGRSGGMGGLRGGITGSPSSRTPETCS
jgi:hypothetical protein